jgi:uncharacterized LabA/DUF88 family protein
MVGFFIPAAICQGLNEDWQMERVAVFVDGSNFYNKLKELSIRHTPNFDYRGLAEWLALGRTIVECGYYVGAVRAKAGDAKAEAMKNQQVNLFNNLQSKRQRFIVHRGYIMENRGVYHEKGVDVKIAVDMLAGAYEDRYDTAILLSSDTDLIPVIQKVRALGKAVEYIGFAHRPSLGLQKHVTLSRLLIRSEIEPFAATRP